jgi:purine-nucleoside phosphorylase
MDNMLSKINEAAAYIREQLPLQPQIGLILGSGLGVMADEVEDAVTISPCLRWKAIPACL